MTNRERINNLFNNKPTDRTAFWAGHPHQETIDLYNAQLNLKDEEELQSYFKSEIRWVPADGYHGIDGLPGLETSMLLEDGTRVPRFAECTDVSEVEKYPWPNPAEYDFSREIDIIRNYGDVAVFTGMWTCFFHIAADFFGMENYFIKMFTDPEVVEAVTGHVVDFYAEGNERFFQQLGDGADTFFMGNDFGTQLSLLISPKAFRQFIRPGYKKNIDIAKKYGKHVMVHCCGAVKDLIPEFIDLGVDGLHPLQAKALGMDAQTLAREFKGKITFMGGVDTQDLLVHASPEQIKDEVRRLKGLLGPQYIVSPSHEAVLPNVPLANMIAMSEAAIE